MFLLILILCGGAVGMHAMDAPHWMKPVLCYGAGLALTLALAARLTPAAWWRRPTVRGLFIVSAGTWACGSALALAAGLGTPPLSRSAGIPMTAAAPASAAQPGAVAVPSLQALQPPLPLQPFRVHRSLNLRAGPDVGSARLTVIAAGAQLTPTGKRSGDWWQVQAHPGGRAVTGWVSSLWLRQLAEHDK